jgi:nucleotide-binding universal stress UspA family protein
MLVRFQSAVGRDDLVEQMILLPGRKSSVSSKTKSNSLTFVVGYSGSPRSHTALDITLLMAHQTRLATNKQVTVEIVYVIEEQGSSKLKHFPKNHRISGHSWEFSTASALKSITAEVAKPKLEALAKSDRQTTTKSRPTQTTSSESSLFDKADQILWQARYLVEEWGDGFIAHLRIGSVAEELTKVVASEAADLLFLGCHLAKHPLVKKLGNQFPCPVLGIPDSI